MQVCPHRFNIDHLCRLNSDQGMKLSFSGSVVDAIAVCQFDQLCLGFSVFLSSDDFFFRIAWIEMRIG
jgi:hypothetical protein